MATYTTNLDLKKPAQSDKIRIADINNNMDTIDGTVGAIGERSIAAQFGDVEGALAIVSVGDVHGAITAGQYVYVKQHSTLDDGLYVASSNISANGALSSSNLTADTAGGLNALNGNLEKCAFNTIDISSYTTIADIATALGNYPGATGNAGIGAQQSAAVKAIFPNPTGFANYTVLRVKMLAPDAMIATATKHDSSGCAVCYCVKGYSSWARTSWEVKTIA